MNKRITIKQHILHDLLDYDRETGVFRWKNPQSFSQKPGDIAGTIEKCGYRRICINNVKYLAHRLAWIYIHGDIPDGFDVCHKDKRTKQDLDNNGIANLILLPHEELILKERRSKPERTNLTKRNTTGVRGLTIIPWGNGKKYKANIVYRWKEYYAFFDLTENGKNEAIKWLEEKRKLFAKQNQQLTLNIEY